MAQEAAQNLKSVQILGLFTLIYIKSYLDIKAK